MKMIEGANLPVEQKPKYYDIIKFISHYTGIGQRTITTTLSDYKKKGIISSPNKNKIRPTITQKIDEFNKNAIQQKIHGFWFRKEIPTLQKILTAVNDDPSLPNLKCTSLRTILKDLSFVYTKKTRTKRTKRISLLATKVFGKNKILSQPRSSNLLP